MKSTYSYPWNYLNPSKVLLSHLLLHEIIRLLRICHWIGYFALKLFIYFSYFSSTMFFILLLFITHSPHLMALLFIVFIFISKFHAFFFISPSSWFYLLQMFLQALSFLSILHQRGSLR